MVRNRILATGPVLPIVNDLLFSHGEVQIAVGTDEDSLIDLMTGTIALIVRGTVRISARLIESAPELRVIGRTGSGFDNIDVAAATRCGIPIVYAPGAGSRAVAEGTMAMLLALAKRLHDLDEKTRLGDWSCREEMECQDLDGAILGIVGLGRIGQQVALLANIFNMRILACDPGISCEVARQFNAELIDRDSLFAHSDFITFHVPLNDQTRGIINKRALRLVKPGAILVNVSRGAVLENLDVLYEALNCGRIAGVGLDVYPIEPPDLSHPIFQLRRVLCTPHVMGLSRKAALQTFETVANGIAMVLDGKVPANNLVNPEYLHARALSKPMF